jgi:hypothetical protein
MTLTRPAPTPPGDDPLLWGFAAFVAAAMLVALATGCDDPTVAVNVAIYPSGRPDGSPCNADAECRNYVCAPVLPGPPLGICYGPGLEGCTRANGATTWADEACSAVGKAVSVCGPLTDETTLAACEEPSAIPADEYPYTCCETTIFE